MGKIRIRWSRCDEAGDFHCDGDDDDVIVVVDGDADCDIDDANYDDDNTALIQSFNRGIYQICFPASLKRSQNSNPLASEAKWQLGNLTNITVTAPTVG